MKVKLRCLKPVQTILKSARNHFYAKSRIICLCHDIEQGLGHLEVDPAFAALANRISPHHLSQMLAIEKAMNIKATYNVVGVLFDQTRQMIEKDGHCLAFHAFDHDINQDQISRCRQLDNRIKGYRPPQSKITPELNDTNLSLHNFAWFASSAGSLQLKKPELNNRIVKIPILFDDFALYKKTMSYDQWEQQALDIIRYHKFIAFSLHDCYAHFWLPHYQQFLSKISQLGSLKTLDEVADEMFSRNSQ